MLVDVERLVVDLRVQFLDVLEHDRAAAMFQQMRGGRRRLDHRAIRR
jgi:hypothetical protein